MKNKKILNNTPLLFKIGEISDFIGKDEIGGKAFGLNVMSKLQEKLGAHVPEAWVMGSSSWIFWKKDPDAALLWLKDTIIPKLLNEMKSFGDYPTVSVRSGAAISMPGMMDTVLNIGLDDEDLKRADKNKDYYVLDCYVSWLRDYSKYHGLSDVDMLSLKPSLTLDELKITKNNILKKLKLKLPPSPAEQLEDAIVSVWKSWDSERAKSYRKHYKISDELGTAVTIQRMVLGNKNEKSATGVAFTKNPTNGANELNGEFLIANQGNALVSGEVTPEDICNMSQWNSEAYSSLVRVASRLENHFDYPQDIEFTIEDGKFWLLQTRNLKVTPSARVRIAVDAFREDRITASEVLNRVSLGDYKTALSRQGTPEEGPLHDTQGLPASSGALSGFAVLDGASARLFGDKGIFIAPETRPEDMSILREVGGFLTAKGGSTSHAAVVARAMGKCCVVGCSDIHFFEDGSLEKVALIKGKEVRTGDRVTIDGETGRIWVNEHPNMSSELSTDLLKLEDIFFDETNFVRITSLVDDLSIDHQSVMLTWRLDVLEEVEMHQELHAACQYLNGVLDLTGTVDHLLLKGEMVPFGSHQSRVSMENKINALKEYKGEKLKFSIHLGKYEEEFGSILTDAGFSVFKSNQWNKEVRFMVKLETKDLKCSEKMQTKMGVTGRVGLMARLKEVI